jgi:transglutaminase-like putative cysteine protease
MPRYLVEHRTRYAYSTTVSTSQHVAHLAPRPLGRQHVTSHAIHVTPTPTDVVERQDYFGNRVHDFTILNAHQELVVTSRSRVTVSPRLEAVEPGGSPAWEAVAAGLRYRKGAAYSAASEFRFASPYSETGAELARYALASFPEGRPLVEGAIDLMLRIHGEFTFDQSATTVTTPVTRVLAERHGVCQDFAHLQISCLRSLGLAARYVSGYLLTDPPPGAPRLVGADASHAWLSVYCPHWGWVDLDPTNACLPDERHVTIGWGRDYGDVSPLRGVILGGAEHALEVGVSVLPVDED